MPRKKRNGTYVDTESEKEDVANPRSDTDKRDDQEHADTERHIKLEEDKKAGEYRETMTAR